MSSQTDIVISFATKKKEYRMTDHVMLLYYITFLLLFMRAVKRGNELKFYLPDILVNGKIRPRTAAKLRDAIWYILKEDGYPVF